MLPLSSSPASLRSGGTKNEACTVVLRGASQHILDEAERSLHDALCVLSQARSFSHNVWGPIIDHSKKQGIRAIAKCSNSVPQSIFSLLFSCLFS